MAPQKVKPIRVRVKRVAVDPEKRSVVFLGTAKREMAIWIGISECQAITVALQGKEMPRPMTHDLFIAALAKVGWTVEKLVIADLRDTTFYGELHLQSGSRRKVIDCRPSDGMALALRAKAPIYVAPHVIEQAQAQPAPGGKPAEGKAAKPLKLSVRRSRRTSA
jgi:bifunctional DNase/RNase